MFDPGPFATELLAARRGKVLTDPRKGLPENNAQAYAVQARVTEALGPVGAFKSARKPGTEQLFAPIFAADIGDSGATFRALPEDSLALELELGLRLRDTPPPLDAPDFAERLRAMIEPVAVFELVGTRLKGAALENRFATLADNQRNAGLVVAAPAPQGSEPTGTLGIFLKADGAVLLDDVAEVPGGDPLASLEALARMLGTHCGGLCKGQIVIIGSLHPMLFVPRGTRVEGRIDGIGSLCTVIG